MNNAFRKEGINVISIDARLSQTMHDISVYFAPNIHLLGHIEKNDAYQLFALLFIIPINY